MAINMEASQTRDYCVAKGATQRAARPDPLRLRSGQALAALKRLLGMTNRDGAWELPDVHFQVEVDLGAVVELAD
jgi:hypothetical protein